MMLVRRPVTESNPADQGGGFWLSYSDLLAGMLMVFVLLLITAMMKYAQSIQEKREMLVKQEDKLRAFHQLQQELITSLEGALEGETVRIDPVTGVVQIGSAILFGEGEANLRPEGQARLKHIFDGYIRVILDMRFRSFIKQIEIEGHTNSNGGYLYNLDLSQRRALAVMELLLDQAGDDRMELEALVLAGGRAYAHLIRDGQGREDPVASRRIEIKFRLKESEMFRDIYLDLEAQAKDL